MISASAQHARLESIVILITGGLGFIGSHTARALLDLGSPCVVAQRNATQVPDFLQPDLGARLVVEALDVEDESAFLEIGKRHGITGIVHLADPGTHRLWRQSGEGSRLHLDGLFDGLFHVLQAARDLDVRRVTIGVYGGVAPGPWSEKTPLPMLASHAIPTVKKCSELLAAFVGGQVGLEVVNVRPSAIWGPGGRTASSFFALPGLVHAAVCGDAAATPMQQRLYAHEGNDICYVKDCGRAIALVQTAPRLRHRTYNVGSGRATTNEEVVAAIRECIPETTFDLIDGRSPARPAADPFLDLTWIREDTGYEPAFDAQRGVADYISWLRAGHDR
jgi:UDP-glucose 4-epimerase